MRARPRTSRRSARPSPTCSPTFTTAGVPVAFIAIPPSVVPLDCYREDLADDPSCSYPALADTLTTEYNDVLTDVVAHARGDVKIVSITDRICPNGICAPIVDDVLLRYDDHHFSVAGARWIVPKLLDALRDAGALPAPLLQRAA